jgi:hypothetical protein
MIAFIRLGCADISLGELDGMEYHVLTLSPK